MRIHLPRHTTPTEEIGTNILLLELLCQRRGDCRLATLALRPPHRSLRSRDDRKLSHLDNCPLFGFGGNPRHKVTRHAATCSLCAFSQALFRAELRHLCATLQRPRPVGWNLSVSASLVAPTLPSEALTAQCLPDPMLPSHGDSLLGHSALPVARARGHADSSYPQTAPATPLHSLVAMDRNRWSPSPGARTCGHPCSLASSVWATDGIASWSAEPRHKAAYPSASNLHAILDYSPNMASVMPETASRGDTALAVAGPRNPHIVLKCLDLFETAAKQFSAFLALGPQWGPNLADSLRLSNRCVA